MRGQENPQTSMFSYVSLEQRVPKDHPLRTLRALVDGILANMSALFDERYSHTGRPSISPEQLLHALLVQILFTIRSERLLDTDIACPFFRRVLHLAQWQGFVSDEHFSVDGTMIEAWASHMTHALSENRNGFVADVESTQTSGRAELETAIRMVDRSVRKPGATIGADKGYDTAEFVGELERRGRRTYRARQGLCDEPAPAKDDRRSLRLDQDGGRTAQDAAQGAGEAVGAGAVCVRGLHAT
jgi:transposase